MLQDILKTHTFAFERESRPQSTDADSDRIATRQLFEAFFAG